MRLPRIVRTTSFRLTLLYAGLFCASVLVLFGIMFWLGSGYIANEIDKSVTDEVIEVQRASDNSRLDGLQRAVATYTEHASLGFFYHLQDRRGRFLAGNVPKLVPIDGVRNWSSHESQAWFPEAVHGVRGRGLHVVDGAYLFVGLDSFELTEMREMIARAFLWGLLGTVLLALGGGAAMSASLLKRVETISETSREIIAGDLARRVPMRGSNDEFDHLATSLNAMLARIESLMEGLRQVSNDIAMICARRSRDSGSASNWHGGALTRLTNYIKPSTALSPMSTRFSRPSPHSCGLRRSKPAPKQPNLRFSI